MMDAVTATIVTGGRALIQLNIKVNKDILMGRRTKCGHLEVKTFHLASLMLSL
jgi:hypothetical protein